MCIAEADLFGHQLISAFTADAVQELKVCAAIIDIFYLIPAASQKMLEPLTVTVLKGEKDLYIEVLLVTYLSVTPNE